MSGLLDREPNPILREAMQRLQNGRRGQAPNQTKATAINWGELEQCEPKSQSEVARAYQLFAFAIQRLEVPKEPPTLKDRCLLLAVELGFEVEFTRAGEEVRFYARGDFKD
jgi:hypothetical protein